MTTTFEEAARLAHEGAIEFNQFAARTDRRWGWWAARFDSRYRLPAWFGADDVKQELLVSAWTALRKFQDGKGPTLTRYVEWNAVKRTTKAVHRARGCNQHTRKGPGRPELVESQMAHSLPDVADDLDVEAAYFKAERMAVVALLADSALEQRALRALASEGSAEAAASVLYEDADFRLDAWLCSEREALRFVRRTAEKIIERFGQEALS